MAVKTKDLIYILPMDEDMREALVAAYDTYGPEQKYEMCELLWDAYHALFDELLENNMNEELESILEGKGELDNTFYARMREKTRKQLQKDNVGTIDQAKLEQARKAMEQIVKEIQASKKN